MIRLSKISRSAFYTLKSVSRLQLAKLRANPIHFLHIGKTGGTTVKEAILSLDCRQYFFVLHGHNVALNHLPQNARFFFSLRDPVDRFVSGFNDRLRESRPRYNHKHSVAEKEAFELFPSALHLAEALTATHPNHRAALGAMRSVGHIRRLQSEWTKGLFSPGRNPLAIIRTESLSSDFNRLMFLLGLDEADVSHSNFGPENSADQVLSPEAVENVRRWYQKDYLLIEQCSAWRGSQTP